ncbi:hypothetical protein WJX72_009169 [[Myrmecia] bisecta]|uniref:Zeta toxin domain-containing protein n=1 Tax=[Myrmecia] bisecta TaxID=41462 RepID=A0AAW1QS51_9CHLO
MGAKPRAAHKVSKAVFVTLAERGAHPANKTALQVEDLGGNKTAVTMTRTAFQSLVQEQLAAYSDKPVIPEELQVACSVREQQRSVTVLLAGTSGTGKSTLAGLLAARLGVTTVLSTDSVRHMMRSFCAEDSNPLLWASTYQAGDYVANAPAGSAASPSSSGRLDSKQRAIKGYKAQSEMVIENLDRLIGSCEARNESLVCEGVHLSLNFVVQLMQRHPSIIPFLIHISNEAKHKERFAVRAKYMTLEAGANRYVKYLRNIRIIQDYLVRRADKHLIPKVDNTNVDRSVATIHATVLACLRRQAKGEVLLDATSRTTKVIAEEYAQCKSVTWSSKDMLEVIRRKVHAAGAGAAAADRPSTSNTPQGPLSEAGDFAEDARSFCDVADIDLISSDNIESAQDDDGNSSDNDTITSTADLQLEEGSVAESANSDADERDEDGT